MYGREQSTSTERGSDVFMNFTYSKPMWSWRPWINVHYNFADGFVNAEEYHFDAATHRNCTQPGHL